MNKNKNSIILVILGVLVVGVLSYIFLRDNTVEISSITLESNSISIVVEESKKINATITPQDATDKTLVWESSNNSVASITEDGTLRGINAGEAIITVKNKTGNVYNKCLVKVVPKEASELVFSEEETSIKLEETKSLNLIIRPEEFRKDVIWTSSDERIVTVSSSGIARGLTTGTAEVKATYGEKEAICKVMVIIPVNIIEIEKKEISIEVGKTSTITPIITPTEAMNQEMKWESSNNEIVTVENGVIKGIREGTATITLTVGGKTASCTVNVTISVEEIKLNKNSLSINKGSSEQLTAVISPSNATNKTITWKSSNENIVKVDDNGKVTGVGAGKATITASIDEKTATSEVVVYNSPITSNSKYTSGYSNVVSYNSETLKYRIMRKGIDEYVLVWVLDANKQWNAALPKLGSVYKPNEILSKEISKYNYEKKGLVATNASFFWEGWGNYPTTPFIMNKGKIIRDIKDTTYPEAHADIGITKDGVLKSYGKFSANDYSVNLEKKNKIINDGVRNTVVTMNYLVKPDGYVLKNSQRIKVTAFCQVDENNYVIYSSGGTLTLGGVAQVLKDTFKCKWGYRLDGGTSRALYYKTGSMKEAQSIHSGRDLPDMMYFVEQ